MQAYLSAAMRQTQIERDRWIRLFNRLEKAVGDHHEATVRDVAGPTEADEKLHAAWRSVLRDAHGRAGT